MPYYPFRHQRPAMQEDPSPNHTYIMINLSSLHVFPPLNLRPTLRLWRGTSCLTAHKVPPSTTLLALPPPLPPLLHRPSYLLTNLIKRLLRIQGAECLYWKPRTAS